MMAPSSAFEHVLNPKDTHLNSARLDKQGHRMIRISRSCILDVILPALPLHSDHIFPPRPTIAQIGTSPPADWQ